MRGSFGHGCRPGVHDCADSCTRLRRQSGSSAAAERAGGDVVVRRDRTGGVAQRPDRLAAGRTSYKSRLLNPNFMGNERRSLLSRPPQSSAWQRQPVRARTHPLLPDRDDFGVTMLRPPAGDGAPYCRRQLQPAHLRRVNRAKVCVRRLAQCAIGLSSLKRFLRVVVAFLWPQG